MNTNKAYLSGWKPDKTLFYRPVLLCLQVSKTIYSNWIASNGGWGGSTCNVMPPFHTDHEFQESPRIDKC